MIKVEKQCDTGHLYLGSDGYEADQYFEEKDPKFPTIAIENNDGYEAIYQSTDDAGQHIVELHIHYDDCAKKQSYTLTLLDATDEDDFEYFEVTKWTPIP